MNDDGDVRELARRLDRNSEQMQEIALVTSPGARVTTWAAKIQNVSSYNVYKVYAVDIGSAGAEPTEIGQQMEAINLAEAFTESGQLPAGTYVVISKVGQKYVFYVPV